MNKNNILIIDDDEELIAISAKVLQKAGYNVTIATTGAAGIENLYNNPPDLILLDVILPDCTGFEVLNRVRSNPDLANIYIILITGSVSAAKLQIKGLQEGADSYLLKPVQNKELVARIDAAFRHINTLSELKQKEAELSSVNKKIEEQNEELKNINTYLKNSHTASLNLLSDLKTEIEERKQAQKAFVESERRFRELISYCSTSCRYYKS